MCLHNQDKTHKALKTYKQRVGWKIFVRGGDKGHPIVFEHQSHRDNALVPLHRWLVTNPKDLISDSKYRAYKPGFHIYLEKPTWLSHYKGAHWVLYKVRWKEPYTVGVQSSTPVVVARKMIVDGPDKERK